MRRRNPSDVPLKSLPGKPSFATRNAPPSIGVYIARRRHASARRHAVALVLAIQFLIEKLLDAGIDWPEREWTQELLLKRLAWLFGYEDSGFFEPQEGPPTIRASVFMPDRSYESWLFEMRAPLQDRFAASVGEVKYARFAEGWRRRFQDREHALLFAEQAPFFWAYTVTGEIVPEALAEVDSAMVWHTEREAQRIADLLVLVDPNAKQASMAGNTREATAYAEALLLQAIRPAYETR